MFTPYLCLFAIAIIISIISLVRTNWHTFDTKTPFDNNWILSDGSPADLTNITDDISFYNTLPNDIKDTDMLLFRAKNIIVKLYINDELVDDYEAKEMSVPLHYKAPGTYFVKLQLNETYRGQTIKIEAISPYKNDHSCNIKNIWIGDSVNLVHDEILNSLSGFCMCLILIFTGCVFLVLSKALSNYSKNNDGLAYLGLFTIDIGVWSATETLFLQLIYEHSVFWHIITGLTLPLTIVPIFLFFKKRNNSASIIPVIIVNVATIGIFLTQIYLHFRDIKDFHESLTLSHIIIIFGAIFTVYYAIKQFIESRYKDISFWGMMAIAIFAILDVIFYKMQLTTDHSVFTRIGLAAYIWFLGTEILRDYIKAYNSFVRTEIISRSAYFDMLTDLRNRTSFMEDSKKVTRDKLYGSVIVVFDMNYLKYINDKYGHTNGDEALIESAEYIKRHFDKTGKCYRIGGDEFVFISTSDKVTISNIKDIVDNFLHDLDNRNAAPSSEKPWPLLIAAGYAVFDETCETFTDAFDIADKMMYAHKQELKRMHPELDPRKPINE